MSEGVFTFKKFTVHHEKAGLKVGTDAVLLGTLTTIPCVCDIAGAYSSNTGELQGGSLGEPNNGNGVEPNSGRLCEPNNGNGNGVEPNSGRLNEPQDGLPFEPGNNSSGEPRSWHPSNSLGEPQGNRSCEPHNFPGEPQGGCFRVLDIGTGTGVVALMLAQRLSSALTPNVSSNSHLDYVPHGGTTFGSTLHGDTQPNNTTFGKTLHGDTQPNNTTFGKTLHKGRLMPYEIVGIDIDGEAAQQAADNFANSPWADRLRAVHASLQDFSSNGESPSATSSHASTSTSPASTPASSPITSPTSSPTSSPASTSTSSPASSRTSTTPSPAYLATSSSSQDSKVFLPESLPSQNSKWQLIVSNPPFFENSLKAPEQQRCVARHTDSLSYRDIISFAKDNLAPDGLVAMILPIEQQSPFLRYAASFGFFPSRIVTIRTTAAKPPKRMVVELVQKKVQPLQQELIMMASGKYTEQYRLLTADFYL